MAVKIGPVIGVEGEKEFRAAFKEIIAQARELDSEMDKLTATFTKNDSALSKNAKIQEQLRREIEKQRDVVEKAKRMQEEAVKAEERTKAAYLDSKDKLAKLNQAREDAPKKIAKLIEAYGEEHPYVQGAISGYNKLGGEIKETEKRVDALATAVHRQGEVTATWGTAVNDAETRLANLKKELNETHSTLKVVGDEMQKWGGAMEEVGTSLTKYVTTPLVAAGTAFIKWSSDFIDGMAKVYTIAEESQKPMSEMRQELIELSNQTGFSLEDLAEAEYQAVSASVATADSVEFLTQATKLARAGFTSTTKSVDILSTIMNSYGKEAYDVAYISDVLLKTQNDGKIVVDQMAEGMGVIVPLAAAYHVGLEDVAAALATMTKQGVPASKSITFIRALFTELEKSSSNVNEIIDTMTGKTFAQLMDEGASLSSVLQLLYNAVDRDSESFERLFGNVRSSQAVASLLNDDFRTLDKELSNMYGAAGQTSYALEMLETPSLKAKRAIQQLKNTGMELGTTLINALYPAFIKVVDGIKVFTEWFAQLDSRVVHIGLGFASVAAATGPVILAVGKLTKTVGTFLAQLAAGTLPLTTIVTLITLAAEAYAGVAVAVEYATEKHREEIAAIWGLDENMRKLIETSNQTAEAYDTQKEAIFNEMQASLENIGVAQQLIDKYNELVDENGEVSEEHQALADVYFNQLAVALGMEQEDLRNLIEENGRFGESIQKTIEDIKQRAEAAAYEKILTEAIYRQTQAQMELEKQEGMLNAQQVKVTEATKQTQAAYEAMIEAQRTGNPEVGRYEQAWRDAVEAESQAKASEAELQSAIEQTRNEVKEAQADADAAAFHIKDNAESTMRDTANAIVQGGSALERSAKNVSNRTAGALSVDGDGIGYQIDAGLANGIDRYSYLVSRSAAQLAYEANHSLRGALSIQSPSKVTAEAGKYFTEGFAIGIQDTLRQAQQSAYMLAQTAMGGLQMGSYEPYPSNTYNKTISAPINIALTVEGNVDGDDRQFTRSIAEDLVNLMNRESEVFA